MGTVLLAAAGLKLYGMRVSPLPLVGEFAAPRLGVAVAVWEIVLGGWLIARFNAFAWLAAFITFLGFTAVSGYYGFTGVASCGCLGAVKASPWAALAVDLAVLALLAWIRPRRAELIPNRAAFSKAGVIFAAASASVLAISGIAYASFGGLEPALAKLRGEKVVLSAGYLDFGEGHTGEALTASIRVANYSDTPLRIYGGTSDCSCTTTANLPLTLAPGQSADVTIRLKVPQAGHGQLTRKVWLLTDHPEQPKLQFRIGCRVID